jgi:hypothetical protein
MGISVADHGALFTQYLPDVVQTLNNTTYARSLPKARAKWVGDHIEQTIHLARNVAVGNTSDGGAFPAAGKQSKSLLRSSRKFTFGTVQLTDGIMATAPDSKGSAESVVEQELTGMMNGVEVYENGMFTRDGTGVVAHLGQTVSGSSITVDDARMLWDGKDFEIRDSATPTTIHIANMRVSSIARAFDANGEATATLSSSIASSGQAAGDYVVWGSGDSSSYGRCITGLDALIDDATGTFQGISVTTYPRYSSVVLDNGGVERALTPALFRQMLAALIQEGGALPAGGITCLTNVWGSISFEELYEGEIRMSTDDTVSGIAVSSFQSTLGKVKVVNDPLCKYGTMFFPNMEEISWNEQRPFDWRRDGPGAPIFKASQTAGVYTATALGINELMIHQRNKCGKIADLAETKITAY